MQSSLKVKLLRGEDLLAADSNGLSDPYCILKLDGEQKKKSETVYKSLNPDWSQEFLFNEKLGELGKLLTIECYDRDAMTSDILGKGDVDVTDLSTSPITVTVELHHPKKGNKGKIYLELVRVKETPDEARRNSIVMETKSTSGLGLTTFMKATYRQATKAAAMTFNPQGGKGQKRMITVDVIRGRGVPAMDNNGYADPYCVIRCGKKKRTTRTQFRTHFPEWRERFIFILFDMGGRDSNMLKVDLWDKDTVGMDDKIASLQIDLSGLPLNSTDERWWVLKKHESKSLFGFGSGKKSDSDSVAVDVEVLLLITVADLFQPQLAPEQLALAQKSSHAWLKVNILRAANLPSLDSNGLSDPFVVVEVENRLMRTHTVSKSLDPEWNCLLETPVKDVFECVNVEVYDEDDNGKYELIGKLCIPLLSISNGVPQWYQLKDSSLLHPVQGCIQIAFHLNYEKIPMMVKSIGRRTQRLMERPENFRFKVLKSHIARIKVFVVNLLNGAVFVNKAMTWQISNEVTIGFGIGWVLFWFFVQLWHLSFASLCGILFLGMQKFRGIKFLSGVFEVEDDEEGEEEEVEDGAEDEDDNEDDTSAKAMVKNPMGFRTQMRQMRIMARTVQNVLGDIASALERTRNLFNWASPTLTAICAFGCFVGTIFLMFIPFRYFAMLFGVNRIVRSGLRKYHPAFKRPMYYIPVIPAKEFLLRVPDDLELEERRRLPLPDSFLAEQRDGKSKQE